MKAACEELIPLDFLGQELVPVSARLRPHRTNRHWLWTSGGVLDDRMAALCGARVKRGWVLRGPGAKFDCLECDRRARLLNP